MKPATTDEVLDLLDASFTATALGAALELGLFWLLEKQPRDATAVAETLGIPKARCGYWLQLLNRAGFIEDSPEGYAVSETARSAILNAYDRDSWALLAEEARGALPGLRDLPRHIREPGSAWAALGLTRRDYVSAMTDDLELARRFTRMLRELHDPLAETLATALDLNGVDRLMDLGGGSGVVSLALLRRYPRLSAVVVDIANVVNAARELAIDECLRNRIQFHPSDFLRDELPPGFDVVLECDVNVYGGALFRRVHAALKPGGRFVIVDQLAPKKGVAPPTRQHWAFQGSMIEPEFAFSTADEIQARLDEAGFRRVSHRTLPPVLIGATRFAGDMTVIEAHS